MCCRKRVGWQYGIGLFSDKPEIVEDRKRRQNGVSGLGDVGAFDEIFLRRKVTSGMTYTGSSVIVFRLLGESNFRMKLWEKDRAAADDIEAHFQPWRDRVNVVCGDGYGVVRDEALFSLILIDPPAIETAAVLATMAKLNERDVPFLCWTPRTSCPIKPTTPDGEGSAAESKKSRNYIRKAAKRGRCLRAQWHRWGSSVRTCGCCITVSAGLVGVVSAAVKQTTKLMCWQFEESPLMD